MARKKIIGIMACDPHGVIALNGHQPWSLPEEWDHFQRTTVKQVIIMGYKTYVATPKAIYKDRYCIVLTHRQDVPVDQENVHLVHSIDEFLKLYPLLPKDKKIFMIGGAELATQFFKENLLDEFLLTKLHQTYEGDTFFPLEYLDNWPSTCIRREKDFSIYRFVNNNPSGILETLSNDSTQADALLAKLRQLGRNWEINGEGHLYKQYNFKNFREAMNCANKVAEIADQENHHPIVTISWGKCTIETWSHDINGLSDRDFNLAAKIEESLNHESD